MKDVETTTGVDQGEPVAAALFCIGLAEVVDKLKAEFADFGVVCFQDDVYLCLPPHMLDAVFRACEVLFAELGLAFNQSKLKVFAPTEEAAAALSPAWQNRRVTSLKVLGQRLNMRLDDEGLPYILGEAASLQAAECQLQRLFD